jgi:hypothetical protein
MLFFNRAIEWYNKTVNRGGIVKYGIAAVSSAIIIGVAVSFGEFPLNDSSAYMGVFIVDYTDSSFEGGYMHELAPCGDCDSLPLQMEYVSPGDFGRVDFKYNVTGEVVFGGTIIWMGTGRIEIPDTLFSPGSFAVESDTVSLAATVKRYHHESLTSTLEIDYAWKKIYNLNIVHDLMVRKSRVGLYLYPPSVGMFDPDKAKIIVFVFRNAVADVSVDIRSIVSKETASRTLGLMHFDRQADGVQAVRVGKESVGIVDLRGRILYRRSW